ncbi:uncharacterized protein L201_006805 [Kwoniella dendrophila CBS 6074]|uniref:Nicotinamide riboside kinase n=1 Tax=Kwoniella dendrophila CBS 6074 TaxID=1295534 RepID=A0AAX4K536_9TREE
MTSQLRKRIIVVGIGGASCSGKTLLAKHLRRALPNGTNIIHQDDFCPTGQHGGHPSHDHLNKQVEVGIREAVFSKWEDRFHKYINEQRDQGVELIWYIVDGFVLYWDKIFLRVPYDTLKARRDERQVYVLQHGGVWVDPPGYFEKIVWPGYVKAHSSIFEEIEKGPVKQEWADRLRVVQPGEGEEGMTLAFNEACEAVLEQCKAGAGSFISA